MLQAEGVYVILTTFLFENDSGIALVLIQYWTLRKGSGKVDLRIEELCFQLKCARKELSLTYYAYIFRF